MLSAEGNGGVWTYGDRPRGDVAGPSRLTAIPFKRGQVFWRAVGGYLVLAMLTGCAAPAPLPTPRPVTPLTATPAITGTAAEAPGTGAPAGHSAASRPGPAPALAPGPASAAAAPVAGSATAEPKAPSDALPTVGPPYTAPTPRVGETPVVIQAAPAILPDSAEVQLTAQVGDRLLAAWTVDVVYDPSRVTPVECATGPESVCNPAFRSNMVRVTGASVRGLSSEVTLATIRFDLLTGAAAPADDSIRVVVVELADTEGGILPMTVVEGPVQPR